MHESVALQLCCLPVAIGTCTQECKNLRRCARCEGVLVSGTTPFPKDVCFAASIQNVRSIKVHNAGSKFPSPSCLTTPVVLSEGITWMWVHVCMRSLGVSQFVLFWMLRFIEARLCWLDYLISSKVRSILHSYSSKQMYTCRQWLRRMRLLQCCRSSRNIA